MSRIRILVIDDDAGDYLMVKEYLEQSDRATFITDHASNRTEALVALAKVEYDVVILDYHLGAENGIDVGKEILRLGYRIPLVLLTGYGEPQVHDDALDAGFQDYLLKNRLTPELLVRSMLWCGGKVEHTDPEVLVNKIHLLVADLRVHHEESKGRQLAHAAALETLRQELGLVSKALVKDSTATLPWWQRVWNLAVQNPVIPLVLFVCALLLVLILLLGSQLVDPALVREIRK